LALSPADFQGCVEELGVAFFAVEAAEGLLRLQEASGGTANATPSA